MIDKGDRMARPEYTGAHGIRRALGALAVAAASLAGFGLGAGHAAADAWVTAPCQWAGQSFRQHDTVYAGGWAFACHTDVFGTPRWDRGARTGHRDSVDSPGADAYAADGYSLGAWQPGTSFFDFCEGDNALMPGADYIYEAVPYNGSVFWRAAGSINQWTFDPGVHHQYRFWESRTCTNGLVD
ncbi:hypothetical protein [Nocardia alni]|uniref:hypothetical protein n=1 Tax=Nocardia alni TaxID=2815723 RepID=UPI001C23D363|nr:hypothetical protein [Nocardia alni]